ncbi:hypothetical protein PSHT_14991 [Puccinia striiformis]|uniref:Uncharacterized protein n=1 Tax=Puccinia striiformis TaxID=27350 RepID=A0A2S4UHL6_9BASI|nr:hypothetical protein PSHT_14991 [Puccinia striiformis]
MNLLSLFLLSLVSQVIMGIDLTSEKIKQIQIPIDNSSNKNDENLMFTLLLIIAQGVVGGTPITPDPNLKTLVSRSPHSDGDVGGDPGDHGGNSAGNPLCPDCG